MSSRSMEKLLLNMSADDRAALISMQTELDQLKASMNPGGIERKFLIPFLIFGCIAVCLNLIILIIILIQRKKTLRQIFYILVMSFALIDVLRGSCLVFWAARILDPGKSNYLRMLDQHANMLLRFTFLATILNILIITLNEFLFIRFPLRYSKYLNRCRVVCCVLCSWTLSAAFVLVLTYIRIQSTSGVYLIRSNITIPIVEREGDVTAIPTDTSEETDTDDGSAHSVEKTSPIWRPNDDVGKLDGQSIQNFTLLAFCFGCLLVIVSCYTSFYRVVRKIQKVDASLLAEAQRRDSLSGAGSNEGDDRKVMRQLLKRHKYTIVIGLVIFVYMLYLLSYAAIQILQYVEKRSGDHGMEVYYNRVVIRLSLQLIVGVHAVLQPLCYFRMREFRMLAIKTIGPYSKWLRENVMNQRGGESVLNVNKTEVVVPTNTDDGAAVAARSKRPSSYNHVSFMGEEKEALM